MANILVIEDEPILARNICDSLAFAGHEAVSKPSGESGLEAASLTRPDLILVDYRLPGMDGLQVLKRLHEAGSAAAIILMTAHGSIHTAVEAMKSGAGDFLTKPLDLQELQLVVDNVLKHRTLAADLDYFRGRESDASAFEGIIGSSNATNQVKTFIQRITTSQVLAGEAPPSILITGETGTGKDLVARAIHYAGPRRKEQFVHVNCTAITDHLAESELFGHVKGAFTDARGDKQGLFEIADKGTLFLDEIGHMPLALQAKLLGAVEKHRIRPVGGTGERKVDVHVIAATNRDLEEAIAAREFREDLYHRFRVLTVTLPPLRERGHDMKLLASHFLKASATRFGLSEHGFTDKAMEAIQAYAWPGNVRELKHTMESAVLQANGGRIGPEHLNIKIPQDDSGLKIDIPTRDTTLSLDFANDCPKLDEIEYQVIMSALEYTKNNASRAARILGISRDAIRYRLDKFTNRDDREPEPK